MLFFITFFAEFRTWLFVDSVVIASVVTRMLLRPACFYRAMYAERGIATAQVHLPSVCDIEVSWTRRLEYFENNFLAD